MVRDMRRALGSIIAALHGGEQVVAWLPAVSPDGPAGGHPLAGVLAVTNERIVFHGLLSSAHDQAVPLNAIIAVDLKRRLSGMLTFVTVSGSMAFEVNGLAGSRWLSAAEVQMERASRNAAHAVGVPARDYVLH